MKKDDTKVTVTIRLPNEMHSAIVNLADEEVRSVNEQIVYLLKKALNRPSPTFPEEGK